MSLTVATASSPRIVRTVRPNLGLTLRYRRQMLALVDEMAASLEYWLTAAYRKEPPVLAMDGPFQDIQKRLRKLRQHWLKRFDEAAPLIAEAYVKAQFAATDSSMMMALKDVGFAVKFEMTPAMREAFQASLAENVSLIRSIPEQYLQQVEGIVARSYSRGRDLATMVRELRELYPVASRRAVLIARDQSNKANAVVNRARQLEIGITDAIWQHSHAGKTPRPDHVRANGQRFKVAEGCLISGRYLQPGEMINCRCTSRAVLPF